MNKLKDNFDNYSLKKGEVIHSNYRLEFLRFFRNHKILCDEISGLKSIIINKETKEKVLITKSNFIFGINKLNSFIIDNKHYITEYSKRIYIEKEFEKLEFEFINDKEYNNYIKKGNDLTITNQIIFNKKYIYYLRKSLDVFHIMSMYLQNSLNIASREIIKNIKFVDNEGFFNNLSIYRDEISNDLGNIKFSTLFDNYKKLMGYFYTYRYLINKNWQKHIIKLLDNLYNYIVLEDVIKYIIQLNTRGDISISKTDIMREEFINIRKSFNMIYFLCNYNLCIKNILPKSKKEILVDNTLI